LIAILVLEVWTYLNNTESPNLKNNIKNELKLFERFFYTKQKGFFR